MRLFAPLQRDKTLAPNECPAYITKSFRALGEYGVPLYRTI